MSLTKDLVVEKAEALATAEMVLNAIGMGNASGQTYEQAVKARADLTIARDRADAARVEYNQAFQQWRSVGFPD